MRGIAAVSPGQGKIDLFWLDQKSTMRHSGWNGSAWDPTVLELGGTFTSVPAATASGSSLTTVGAPPVAEAPPRSLARSVGVPQHRADVFAIGLDFAMYHKALRNGIPDAQWENLGGIFTSTPAAIAWADNRIDVFGLGTDYAMFHKTWNGSAWSATWERLGGNFNSEAFAVSWGPTRLDIFARGVDFSLRHRSYNGTAWSSDWQNLGGVLACPPVATTWGPNRLDVFAIDASGQVCHRWWDGDFWSEWETLPLPPGTPKFTSPPTAVSTGPDRLDVFAVGADAVVRHLAWTAGSWGKWEDLGGSMTSGPTAIATTGAGARIDVFAPANGGAINHRFESGTAWSPPTWQNVGGPMRLPARYRFSLDYVRVDTARSLNSDTDYGQCSVSAAKWQTRTATQKIGDIGGTDINESQTNLLFIDPVDVDFCEPVIFNYSVVNNGHDGDAVVEALVAKSGEELIEKLTDIDGPLADFLLDQFFNVIFADCDGWVAVDQHSYLGVDVYKMTLNGPFTRTTEYSGSDSPTGCGANSLYKLTWSIHRSSL